MDKFHQDLFDVLIRCRGVSNRKRESKAASLALGSKWNKQSTINPRLHKR